MGREHTRTMTNQRVQQRAHVGRFVRHNYYLTFVTFIISSHLINYPKNILTQFEVACFDPIYFKILYLGQDF